LKILLEFDNDHLVVRNIVLKKLEKFNREVFLHFVHIF